MPDGRVVPLFTIAEISPHQIGETAANSGTFRMARQLRLKRQGGRPMLRIHRTSGRTVVFTISGQLGADNLDELCQVVDAEPAGSSLVLDLRDLVLADRAGVRLLREYETRGRVALRHCPAYVRTWMGCEPDQL